MPREYNASFQQAQFLTNSPVLAEVLKPAAGNNAERLTAIPDPAVRVKETFLTVYGREAETDEAAAALEFLNARPDKPAEAIRDLLWALMTSAEFLTAPR